MIMEPITWSIAVQATQWLTQALAAAKNKDQQRFARLIEHVGTVTAGLRALDREVHRLFLPMLYSDIRQWPEDRRQSWAQDIINLAHESKITPAMHVSLAALVEIQRQTQDRDVSRLLSRIITLLGWPPRGLGSVTACVIYHDFPSEVDNVIRANLFRIVEALEHPERTKSDGIKYFVKPLIQGDTRRWVDDRDLWELELTINASKTEAANPVTMLRPYADELERVLGELLGLQYRVFPALPTPFWVWQ